MAGPHFTHSRPAGTVISIVSPFYNEEEAVDAFHAELTRVLDGVEGIRFRMVFVDDGSADGTLAKLNALASADRRVRVYSLSRNFGHQVALSAGLDAATGDAVILMDSDLQHPPALLPEMIARWQEGSDIVSAVRGSTEDATGFKRLTSGLFYTLFNFLSDTPIVPGAADFCLLSRKAYRSIREMPERHRFLRGMVSWVGFRRTFIRYDAAQRVAGRSKYSPVKMMRLATDAVFSFSTKPLRMATRLGLLLAAGGGLYIAYAIVMAIAMGITAPGWASLLCTVLVIGGVQLIFVGILGEYLARVLEQVKARPLYFFKQMPPPRNRTRRRRGSDGVAATGVSADESAP